MRNFDKENKPNIVISRCINFERCRYNGDGDNNKFVDKLKEFVNFTDICPESDIGMPTPRKPIRLVRHPEDIEGKIKLLQPATGNDYSDLMYEYADALCRDITNVDGFILKNRSPSCGLSDVKIYTGVEKGSSSKKGSGIVGGRVRTHFSKVPVEDDGRLKNFNIREDFLTRLYTLKEFKDLKEENSLDALMKFHSNNKLLLMSYHSGIMHDMGRILGNSSQKTAQEAYEKYHELLVKAMSRESKHKCNLNVLNRCLGFFSKDITKEERSFIHELMEDYKDKRVPLSVPLNVLRGYVIRFDIKNLQDQTFFEPYPKELVEVTDSGKGRK